MRFAQADSWWCHESSWKRICCVVLHLPLDWPTYGSQAQMMQQDWSVVECFVGSAPGSCPRMWAFLPTWMCLESSLKTMTYWQQTPWRMHVGWLTQSSQARRRLLLCTNKRTNRSEQAASLAAASGLLHNLSVQDVLYINLSVCYISSWTSQQSSKFPPKPPCSAVCLICLCVSVTVLFQLSPLHSVQCLAKDKQKHCRQNLYIMQHVRCVNICHWCQ